MQSSEFNSIYLNDLLEKLSHENKKIILMGDFDIDLLKYDTHGDSSDFLDAMYASFLLPYINTPSRVTPHSKTLIDKIFSNTIEDSYISENLVTTISDHYGQFLLMKNLNNKKNITKTEVYHQDFQNINEKRLENDLQNTSWDDVLEVHSEDIGKSFETFFSTINSTIDRHAPLKKMSLKERKLKLKPWIRKGILTSINNKNKAYRKHCRAKDQNRKHELHTLFKQYRNSLNNIIKVSKANHYHQYFTANKINLLKVCEEIKEIIHTKPKNKKNMNSLRLNGTLCTEQKKIANSLNMFFCNIPKEIEKKLIPPNKDFSDYLKHPANNTFYISPTNAREVEQKLKTLKTNKAVGLPAAYQGRSLKLIQSLLASPYQD